MGQGMVQGMAPAQALGMAKQVDPVELMLVEVAAVEGVEGDKMEDLGMVLAQVLGMVRLVDMGLVVDHMLMEEVKVEVAAVDKMGALDLALGLVTVKLVDMGHMVEGRMLKEVDKVEVVAAGKMVGLDMVPVPAQDTVKLVDTILITVVDMLMQEARVAVAVAGKVVQVAVDLGVALEAGLGQPKMVAGIRETSILRNKEIPTKPAY
jgi:hypothetical protein